MYDDLLGERKKKVDIDIGYCGECGLVQSSTVHKNQKFLYCTRLKKYVHPSQSGCLKFKRKEVEFGIC